MAKIPALVSALARVDGRERKTIDHIARVAREDGYLPTGKRGGGAADTTPRVAADLLIALNGADTPKEAGIAIDRFRSLQQFTPGNSKKFRDLVDSYDSQPTPIQRVMDAKTFGQALEGLIETVPELVASLWGYWREAYDRTADIDADPEFLSAMRVGLFGLNVTFERYFARIVLYTMHGTEERPEFVTQFRPDPERLMSGFYGPGNTTRRVAVTIHTEMLIAAWQGINPGVSLPGIPDNAPPSEDVETDE